MPLARLQDSFTTFLFDGNRSPAESKRFPIYSNGIPQWNWCKQCKRYSCCQQRILKNSVKGLAHCAHWVNHLEVSNQNRNSRVRQIALLIRKKSFAFVYLASFAYTYPHSMMMVRWFILWVTINRMWVGR